MDVIDLTGKTFGYLTVIKYVGITGHYKCKKYGTLKGYHTWECKCKCGVIKNIRSTKLRNNNTVSCGCKKKTNRPIWTLPEGQAAKNLLLHTYKESAKKKNLSFSLTKEEFINITSQNCYYCNAKPYKSMALRQKGTSNGRSLNGDYIYNGIDREDNSIGYELSNCLPCCWKCNELKSNSNKKDFINHLRKIIENIDAKHN